MRPAVAPFMEVQRGGGDPDGGLVRHHAQHRAGPSGNQYGEGELCGAGAPDRFEGEVHTTVHEVAHRVERVIVGKNDVRGG